MTRDGATVTRQAHSLKTRAQIPPPLPIGGYESAIIFVDEAQQFTEKELQWIKVQIPPPLPILTNWIRMEPCLDDYMVMVPLSQCVATEDETLP